MKCTMLSLNLVITDVLTDASIGCVEAEEAVNQHLQCCSNVSGHGHPSIQPMHALGMVPGPLHMQTLLPTARPLHIAPCAPAQLLTPPAAPQLDCNCARPPAAAYRRGDRQWAEARPLEPPPASPWAPAPLGNARAACLMVRCCRRSPRTGLHAVHGALTVQGQPRPRTPAAPAAPASHSACQRLHQHHRGIMTELYLSTAWLGGFSVHLDV